FPTEKPNKKALIIGGGVGIPPMLALAEEWKGEADIVLGYRDEAFLLEEFEAVEFPVHIASDSGRIGKKGTVMDVICAAGLDADVIFACGPKPMLKAIRTWAGERGIPAYISMEERMACGVGVCLGCVCESAAVDTHSKVHNKRVCKDGPVFEAQEVVL
ncbi:MAG: dihydroorotate dehydrogenase electron transfer subunit, partial [Lachnospiraceae bacterium]|nr:dihydroorotate dehydrogenase electron transfer subunit [Lachnospiraceae bacterium]